MLIYIDPSISGIGGDMALAALLDLGAGREKLLGVADTISKKLGCKIKVEIKKVEKRGIFAVKVGIEEEGRRYSPSRLQKTLTWTLDALSLSSEAKKFASEVLNTLLDSEARVHGVRKNRVHLHELGSADTLVDIAGVAALADELGLFKAAICSSPVATGKTPMPVTVEILRKFGIPFKFSGGRELATPTGVALLANLVDYYEVEPPVLQIDAMGTGAGSLDLATPNILRIMKCKSLKQNAPSKEFVSVLETSVDDVSGEVLGYALERLYEEGALDVQVISTITKKNRPSYVIVATCRQEDEEKLAGTLMEETGTLGVRVSNQKRFCANRRIIEIDFSIFNYRGKARVKAAVNSQGKIINIKAEYEDAKKIAKKTGMPLREVIKEIEKRAAKFAATS